MARKKKATRVKKNKVAHRKLIDLLDRYGKIKVVFTRDSKTREVSQERIIGNNGMCVVRYAEKRHKKDENGSIVTVNGSYVYEDGYRWSRYRTSCFRGDIAYAMKIIKRKKDRSRLVVEALRQHDLKYIFTEAVYVGKGFKKRIA